ncbi:hypothetical protein ACFRSX_08870 [Streptomyces goshikiensis]|uniref:hypothetical protein n=1 Tax=Streptomyces TaxID=1883 RepID=UPI0009405636|nr:MULTISPECIES: hypothetical protein [unclassified Streptomyces]OKI41995.1 hypothetical protein A6A28_25960 [Streptomyces sp. CB03578]PJN18375.1 hypothetical protein CG724_12150 [Streptomyces sp. CB02120-2]
MWQSIVEGTAYGIQILRAASLRDASPAVDKAVRWITEHRTHLWPRPPRLHDRTLYTPATIIGADTTATMATVEADGRSRDVPRARRSVT